MVQQKCVQVYRCCTGTCSQEGRSVSDRGRTTFRVRWGDAAVLCTGAFLTALEEVPCAMDTLAQQAALPGAQVGEATSHALKKIAGKLILGLYKFLAEEFRKISRECF